MQRRPELPLYGVAVLTLVAIVVLILTGHAVPDLFGAVLLSALTGGAGATVPRHLPTTLPAPPPATEPDPEADPAAAPTAPLSP